MPLLHDVRSGKLVRAARAWLLIAGGGLLVLGLFVGLPVYLMISHQAASDDPWLLPVVFGGFSLGLAGSWWLKRPLGPAAGIGPGLRWEVGGRHTREQAFQARAGKLCVVMALASYYLPGLFVVVFNQGWGGVDTYLHGHLLDGFTFVALLTAAWALVLRDYQAAVRQLIRSTAIIAVVAVYLAGGRVLEVVIAGIIAEAFGEYFWAQVSQVGVEVRALQGDTEAATKLWAHVSFRQIDRLGPGDRLTNGQCLRAADKEYIAIMLGGELSVWRTNQDRPLWSSGTWGTGADCAELDADGRLVLREQKSGMAIWATGMPGGQAQSLVIQSGGNLVAYRADDTPAWTIVTSPRPYNLKMMAFTVAE